MDGVPNESHRIGDPACRGTNGADLRVDAVGRFGRLTGELLNFVGDDRKTFAGLSGAGRFDRGVER